MLNISNIYYTIIDLFRNTYTGRIIQNFFELTLLIGPYFLISLLLNVLLRRYLQSRKLFRISKNEIISIIVASLIGLISPLPTYIAVPMGLSLISTGIPFSAITAFMVSSPLMNPGIFYLTLSQLGPEIAFARVISAFFLAILAGFLTKLIWKNFAAKIQKIAVQHSDLKKPLWREFINSFLFLGRYFGIALFLGAIIKALVPPEMVTRILGSNTNMSMMIAIALGVPFYSCGGAAIPLIQVLSQMGMNKGAVLAFFIAGPSTKLETIYVYKSLLGIHFLIFYLTFIFAGAFLCGLLILGI